jgi:hypothetical protein
MTQPRSVRPAEIVAYLRAAGWRVLDDSYEGAALWGKSVDGAEREVFVPLREGAPDFGRVFERMVKELAALEKRAPARVERDMAETSADAISYRVLLDGGRASRLPLAYAPTIFKAAHDITIAAANAASRTRASYRNWTKEVHDFAARAEVGQTEAGSYVVRILCSVAHVPQPQLQRADEELPFERRVTQTLHGALHAARRAAERAITMEDLSVFDEAVSAGVSSNLCSALASVGTGPESVALEIGLRWAALRDQSVPQGGPFFFGRDLLEVLGSAAMRLRDQETEELPDQEITGFVTSLERGGIDKAGTVVVYGFLELDDRPGGFRCSIELTGEQYALAARAHVEHVLVSVRGLVRRVGHKWWLEEPTGFWIDASAIAQTRRS